MKSMPLLSAASLESLVIAALKLETVEGLKLMLSLTQIFTPQILEQLPMFLQSGDVS